MMPICNGCADQRKGHHLAARNLVEFQIKDFGKELFKSPKAEDISLFLCIYCDGPASEHAEDVIFRIKTKNVK